MWGLFIRSLTWIKVGSRGLFARSLCLKDEVWHVLRALEEVQTHSHDLFQMQEFSSRDVDKQKRPYNCFSGDPGLPVLPALLSVSENIQWFSDVVVEVSKCCCRECATTIRICARCRHWAASPDPILQWRWTERSNGKGGETVVPAGAPRFRAWRRRRWCSLWLAAPSLGKETQFAAAICVVRVIWPICRDRHTEEPGRRWPAMILGYCFLQHQYGC